MTEILTQPKSVSLLQSSKFQLNFKRAPDIQYFCQKVKLPGGKVNPVEQVTPFKNRMVAGHKLEYETLDITFLVEEYMYSWDEIHRWLKDIGTETGFGDYRDLRRTSPVANLGQSAAYSDAILTVLSTQNNPKIRFHFKDCFPISLGDIDFDTTKSAEEAITVDCQLGFFYYDLERVQG